MKKIIFTALVAALPFFTFAQLGNEIRSAIHQNNLDGVRVNDLKKVEMVGTIFLDDNWTNAIVKLADDKVYNDILLKYNVLDDLPYFQGDVEMKFAKPVKEFSLLSTGKSTRVFKSGFPKISGNTEASFYQVLAEGNAILLKKASKRITDRREYNSAVTTQEVVNSTKYFLSNNGSITEVQRNKSSFLSVLGKKDELENFISTNKVDFKNDDHLARLVSFYNTLK